MDVVPVLNYCLFSYYRGKLGLAQTTATKLPVHDLLLGQKTLLFAIDLSSKHMHTMREPLGIQTPLFYTQEFNISNQNLL